MVTARPKSTRRRKGWVEQQSEFWYRLVERLTGLLFRFWVRQYRVSGVEKIPRSGGAFLIANHTSAMDPFLLGYPVQYRMPRGPGKVSLFANPVIGYLMKKIGMFPLRQDGVDAGGVRTMVELYRSGKIVIIYPEGARSADGELKSFFPDFARLVIKLRAPVIPAAIAGAARLLPIGSYIPRFNVPVNVVFGDPFELTEFYERPLTSELALEAAQILKHRVDELLQTARLHQPLM